MLADVAECHLDIGGQRVIILRRCWFPLRIFIARRKTSDALTTHGTEVDRYRVCLEPLVNRLLPLYNCSNCVCTSVSQDMEAAA